MKAATRASDPAWIGLFSGPFAHMAGAVEPADAVPADAVRARDLAAPERLVAIMDAYERHYPGADTRAVVSMWSQWYFALLAAPLALAALRTRAMPPATLDDVAVRLRDGRPAGMLLLSGTAGELIAEPFALFAPLVDGHLAPMVHALRRVSRVSERLLWNNAAVQVDWVLRTVRAQYPDGCHDVTQALVNARLRPDGSVNPLYQPVRPAPIGVTPIRRVCCLRYLLPDELHCANACPLPNSQDCP